jgi:hypothetical protein
MQRKRHLHRAGAGPQRTRSFNTPILDVLQRKIAIWSRREDAVVRGTRRAA